jgi:hypothetical protein
MRRFRRCVLPSHVLFTLRNASVIGSVDSSHLKGFGANFHLAGNQYSIRNVGSGTARMFFAQGREMYVQDEE